MDVFTRTDRARRSDYVLAFALFACDLVVVFLTLTSLAQDSHYYGDGGAHRAASQRHAVQFLLVSAAVTGLPPLLVKRWITGAVQVLVLGGAALAVPHVVS